jgi:hypothetical protein
VAPAGEPWPAGTLFLRVTLSVLGIARTVFDFGMEISSLSSDMSFVLLESTLKEKAINIHKLLVPFVIDIVIYYASQQINYNISLSRKLLECQYEKNTVVLFLSMN